MKCFYHKGDLDGWCSAAIIRYKFPQCKLIGLDYVIRNLCKQFKANSSIINKILLDVQDLLNKGE